MTVNQATIDLIKKWEGFKAKAYLDTIAKPPLWTIGYGTTARARVGIVPEAGMTITEAQAEKYLRLAVDDFAKRIRPHITAPINDNEFGAFVSLAYNIGPGAFIESTALRRFNDGDKGGAVEALQWFNKAGGKRVKGLANRRADEARLFMTSASNIGNVTAAPQSGIVALIIAFLKRLFR